MEKISLKERFSYGLGDLACNLMFQLITAYLMFFYTDVAGIGLGAISLIMLIYFLVVHFMGRTVHGWTSTIVSIWAIGGLQLLAIGIVGEYIGKIYLETKARPKYIIETVLDK